MVLTASAGDGLTVDAQPFSGEVRLGADTGPVARARVALGERRLVVLVREGSWGVRDFDPAAPGRQALRGIAATTYDPRWSVPARFTPYGEDRTVRVANADGREHDGSYRFRFLYPAAPDAEGRTTVDFNRALLPPCAFADHFVCPFPPPGNTLDVAVAAGERNLVRGAVSSAGSHG